MCSRNMVRLHGAAQAPGADRSGLLTAPRQAGRCDAAALVRQCLYPSTRPLILHIPQAPAPKVPTSTPHSFRLSPCRPKLPCCLPLPTPPLPLPLPLPPAPQDRLEGSIKSKTALRDHLTAQIDSEFGKVRDLEAEARALIQRSRHTAGKLMVGGGGGGGGRGIRRLGRVGHGWGERV